MSSMNPWACTQKMFKDYIASAYGADCKDLLAQGDLELMIIAIRMEVLCRASKAQNLPCITYS